MEGIHPMAEKRQSMIVGTAATTDHHHHALDNHRIITNDYPCCEDVSNLSSYYGPPCRCTIVIG